MSKDSSDASVRLDVARRVDQACDRFEAAWRTGPRPAISDFLAGAPESDLPALFRALLLLEIVLRCQGGERPILTDYKQCFPAYGDLIEAVFAEVPIGNLPPPETGPPNASSGLPTTEGPGPCEGSKAEAPPPLPDRIGRYKVRALLGEGAYGSVYQAHDDVMDRLVAIKVPSLRLLASQNARDQFLSEARSVARLQHEGIVRAFDFGQEADDRCYIVYEFIEGTNLKDRIKSENIAAEPLPPDEAATIVSGLARALHYAHLQGLVHRDIKPANILLDRQGKPRLTDFGLAVREEDLWKERGRRAGTLPYMSPEQVRLEGHHIDGRSDIYSLGVVLYELLCGRRPFEAGTADELEDQILHREVKPPRQINDAIPPELERVCLRALSKRVQDRYTNAKDMAQAIVDGLGSSHSVRATEIRVAPEEFERLIASANADELRRLLRLLQHNAESAFVPQIFRCLSHPSEAVRQQARRAVHRVGLDKVSDAAEDLARREDAAGVAAVLDGLAAFESHPQIVALLDRLVVVLKGDLRNRAILLLERKRLGLELDVVAGLFRDIHSPYRIEKVLGQGLFAASYLARTDGSDLAVVVRVLRPELAGQPHLRTQFLDLSRSALQLVHENLALTREARAFPDRNMYFAVRDYVDGVTLQKVLEGGKVFDAVQIGELLKQLLAALGVVHRRGLCHGGVKPSNIFICKEGKVILGDPSLPVHGVGMALDRLSYDYRYVAPEMFHGGEPPGPESDFYALGCVGYELVCGEPPFISDNYVELAVSHLTKAVVPPAQRGGRALPRLDPILLKLLARRSKDRYTTADQVLRALSEAISKPPLDAVGKTAEPARPLMRDTSLAALRLNESVLGFEASMASMLPPGGDTWSGSTPSALPATDMAPALQPLPRRIGGYDILEVLGRGAMGTVFKARDPRLDRVVALKMLPSGSVDRVKQLLLKERYSRMLIEARAVARLQHPNIVQVYDIGEHESLPYVVLEYVGGGSLADKLLKEAIAPRAAAETIALLARALQHAHEQGVLHRDLKPSNVLLTLDGQPKITDFGLAKLREFPQEAALTVEGMIIGTPAYMAPEQAAGKIDAIGPLADVYGLGAIFYESLTKQPPFQGRRPLEILSQIATAQVTPPEVLNKAVDRDLSAICLKCLHKDPQQRYDSAAALADDIQRWLGGLPIMAAPPAVAGGFIGRIQRSLAEVFLPKKRS